MDHATHCDALAEEVERFAAAYGAVPGDTPVPSCPGWTADDLAEHLGHVHRWAEHLVRVQAPERISPRDMGFDRGPANPAWIRAGGADLVATLRAGDPDAPMWAWGADQHLRFWSRRQLHETLVHRMDAELAGGAVSGADPAVAADAVDEFLGNLAAAGRFSPRVAELHGQGTLRFAATDAAASWTVTLRPDGFEVAAGGDGAPAAALSAPAATLLLVLYRRTPLADSGATVEGRAELVDFWLSHSALE